MIKDLIGKTEKEKKRNIKTEEIGIEKGIGLEVENKKKNLVNTVGEVIVEKKNKNREKVQVEKERMIRKIEAEVEKGLRNIKNDLLIKTIQICGLILFEFV